MKKVITSSATSFKGPLLASLSPERERKRERTSRRGIIPISTLKHTCQLRGMDWGYAMLLSPNKDETIVHGCIARMIWLCACVRYWIYRGVGTCASMLKWERTLGIRLWPGSVPVY